MTAVTLSEKEQTVLTDKITSLQSFLNNAQKRYAVLKTALANTQAETPLTGIYEEMLKEMRASTEVLAPLVSGIKSGNLNYDDATLDVLKTQTARQQALCERVSHFHVYVLQDALKAAPAKNIAAAGIVYPDAARAEEIRTASLKDPCICYDARDCNVMIDGKSESLVFVGAPMRGKSGGHPNFTMGPLLNMANYLSSIDRVLSKALHDDKKWQLGVEKPMNPATIQL